MESRKKTPLMPTAVNPDDLRPGDRFRAVYEYRVDHRGDWQPAATNRYELIGHDDDPAVAAVRDYYNDAGIGSSDDGIRDLLARIDAARADRWVA